MSGFDLLKIRAKSYADVFQEECTRDRLSTWAQELGKDLRTVRRYAQSGIIPNAYQTSGGQWRAPFSSEVLDSVKEKLRGFGRSPRRIERGWPRWHESDAEMLTVAYALFLACKRKRFREAALLQFHQRVLLGLAHPTKSERIHRAEKKWEDWKRCVTLANRLGVRMAALVAAYAHAVVELSAESKDEARTFFLKGRFLRFGHSAKGEIGLPGTSAKPKRKQKTAHDRQSSRLRNQVISLAKRRVSLRSVVQKWQWIVGQRSIKSAKERGEILTAYPGHPDRSYVHLPKRYYSRRTFYNWFKNEDRKRALHEAGILLLGSQQETKEQSEGEDS